MQVVVFGRLFVLLSSVTSSVYKLCVVLLNTCRFVFTFYFSVFLISFSFDCDNTSTLKTVSEHIQPSFRLEMG